MGKGRMIKINGNHTVFSHHVFSTPNNANIHLWLNYAAVFCSSRNMWKPRACARRLLIFSLPDCWPQSLAFLLFFPRARSRRRVGRQRSRAAAQPGVARADPARVGPPQSGTLSLASGRSIGLLNQIQTFFASIIQLSLKQQQIKKTGPVRV